MEEEKRLSEPKTTANILDLQTDMLRQIFIRLDIASLKSASCVSKTFRSITSSVVRKLAITSPNSSYQDITKMLQRFSSAKEVHINVPRNHDKAFLAISNSSLQNLETLRVRLPNFCSSFLKPHTMANMSTSEVIRGIKSLKFDHVFYDIHLVIKFIHMFSCLTELDIVHHPMTNDRVHKITSKYPNLRKISISTSCGVVADETLSILSANCPNLESVNFQRCMFSAEALHRYFCDNLQLTSVDMPVLKSQWIDPHHLPFVDVAKCMNPINKNLIHVSLQGFNANDLVLTALAKSRPPLRSLVIGATDNYDYTVAALYRLFSVCPNLESLSIHLPRFGNCNDHDEKMSLIVKGLPRLKHVSVTSRAVCQATLFSLVQNCSLLETIYLERVGPDATAVILKKKNRSLSPLVKNHSIRSIEIRSPKKSDVWLRERVELNCPNLKH